MKNESTTKSFMTSIHRTHIELFRQLFKCFVKSDCGMMVSEFRISTKYTLCTCGSAILSGNSAHTTKYK